MSDLLSSFELYRTAVPASKIRPIPLKKLRDRREERWLLQTRVGTIILRRIGYLDAQAMSYDLMENDETYRALALKAQEYENLMGLDVDISPETEKQYDAVGVALAPYEKYFQMLCFVQYDEAGKEIPQFECVVDYEAFLSFLTADELTKLMSALVELLAPIANRELPEGDLLLANELGIKLTDDLTMDRMSLEEAKVYSKTVQKKYENAAKGIVG